MVRVLHIIGSLNMGGAENFVVNLYRNIDKEIIQFDFILYNRPRGNNFYEEVEKLGAKIYYVPSKKSGLVKNYKAIKEIVKQQGYKIVWRHASSCFAGIDIIAAKAGGATRRILHSHNTRCGGLERKLHHVCRPFVNRFVTDRFACGNEAGKWMYGRRKYRVIPNGIDVMRYKFQGEIREVYRKNLGVYDKTVIGHIGRFERQKNHDFIIDIFREFYARNNNAILLLVGTGSLQENIHEKVKRLGLMDKVLFLNTRMDVPELMQAMDVLLMPSLFEGLPVSLVEAQAAGLPCVISDVITKEVDLTGNVRFVSLKQSAQDWAEIISQISNMDRDKAGRLVKAAGYDAGDVALRIQEILI